MRTFSTRLRTDLRRRLRRHAVDTDQTLEQLMQTIVEEYLSGHEENTDGP